MLEEYYEWIKVVHIVSIVCWMVGMFYLPRLYVYHAESKKGSEKDKVFQVMEKKLLRTIMNPAVVVAFVTGLMLANIYGFLALGTWFHIKLFLVLILMAMHGFLAKWRVDFHSGKNKRSVLFYKVFNESVTVVFVLIIIMVVVKPFEG